MLSKKQQEIVDKARWVAMECLEPRAAEYDETASHPRESWNDLWKHDLLAIGVPQEHGGLGLDMPTYVRVIESLAQGCTNSAMTLHMHTVVQRYIDALGTPDQKAQFYPDVVEQGKMFGSWGSEPQSRGGSASSFVRDTVISPVDDGYIIDGRKHFCTMAGAAHRVLVHSSAAGYHDEEGYQLALVPGSSPGMTISGDWNTLGMRGTVSPAVIFEQCLVDRDCVLGEPGAALRTGVGEGFGLGYAAIYLGAARRALDLTVEYTKTHQFAPDPTPLSDSLIVQRSVAEMTMALDGARLALYDSASKWQQADAPKRLLLAVRAKYPATEAALMVTSRCLQTVGGRSAHKGLTLERLYRDVRTATLMPPNADRAVEIVGKAELGVEDFALESRQSP